MTTEAKLAVPETEATAPKSLTRYIPTAARILLGLLFFAAGIMGFLAPPPIPRPSPRLSSPSTAR